MRVVDSRLLAASCFAGLSSIWRHSAKIGRDGFLMNNFPIQGVSMDMAVRQVPGDGNCLFHAISVCLDHACNGTHPSLDLNELMPKSASLRKARTGPQVAVDYLVDNLKGSLYLEKEESVPVYELLSVVAAQYNMTAEHYCEASDAMDWAALGNRGSPGAVMRQSSVWGGGPEIVALSNALCRPIHVYELASNGVGFCFRRMACFGSPNFDDRQAIHILSADSRFPNLKPGKQLTNGNHFLALFPCQETVGTSPGQSLGGPGESGSLRGSAAEASAIGGGKQPGFLRRFLSSLLTCSCLRRKTEDVTDSLGTSSESVVEAGEGVGSGSGASWQRGAPFEGEAVVVPEAVSGARGGGKTGARRWRGGRLSGQTAIRRNGRPVLGWTRVR
ncbi:unnamed protein product [Ascophyllum nodosum]